MNEMEDESDVFVSMMKYKTTQMAMPVPFNHCCADGGADGYYSGHAESQLTDMCFRRIEQPLRQGESLSASSYYILHISSKNAWYLDKNAEHQMIIMNMAMT